MKIILLSIFISFQVFAQSNLLLLFDGGRVYNGTELITRTIDKGLEPVSLYSSNFTVNTDGWSQITTNWGTGSGNLDAYNVSDCLGVVGESAGLVWWKSFTIASAQRYKATSDYYIKSATVNTYRLYFQTTPNIINDAPPTLNAWTTTSGSAVTTTASEIRFRPIGTTVGDSIYLKNIKITTISNFTGAGNHSIDTSSTYKQAGSYSAAITASAAGDGTTNTISLASTLFTAVTNGLNYRFQLYAYTSTANTTLTFKLGDIVKTAIVPTSGMSVVNFDFTATASTTGNILLYLDKAATVYIDDVSLKSGN